MMRDTALKLLGLGLLGSWQMIHADAFLDVNGVFTTITVPGPCPGLRLRRASMTPAKWWGISKTT